MPQKAIHTTWEVRFTREDGDDWPDLPDYGSTGRMYRPGTLTITVIQQPWAAPAVYHADVHAYRVRKDGSLGTSAIFRGWAGEYVTDPDAPEHVRAPGWVSELARQALDGVTRKLDPAPVWVTVISQPHGNRISADLSYEEGRDELARWVRASWEHVAGGYLEPGESKPDSPDGLGDDEAIALYFENNDDEWYELASVSPGWQSGTPALSPADTAARLGR